MRFTEVQCIINEERRLAIWNSRLKKCVLPAFSMRFQRDFYKYKNVGGRVSSQAKLYLRAHTSLS